MVSNLGQKTVAEGRRDGVGSIKDHQVAVDSIIEVRWGVCKVYVAENGCFVDRGCAEVCWC